MKRDLIIQIRNEWRDNIWLVIGLTIVSLAIWWLTMLFYKSTFAYFYKRGFDIEDVYTFHIRPLPAESPDYVERPEEERAYLDSQDLRMLITAIRKSPYVEAAAFSVNGMPYSLSFYGNSLFLDMTPEDTLGYMANLRLASPDMVRVLKLTSRTGKSADYLEKALRDGEILISNTFIPMGNDVRKPEELNGKTVNLAGEKGKTYRVGDIVDYIRRSDYDLTFGGMALFPIDEESNIRSDEIGIRMKPGMGEKFREQFENEPSQFSHGNYFLTRLTKMSDRAKSLQKSNSANVRMRLTMILLLLIIIGLGMFGVFWFRIQQRVSEIAIRKACGAKTSDIFRRIITEGLILLTAASVLAAAIGWPALHITWLKEDYIKASSAAYMEIATFAIVAVGITLSLWWPARKAMAIEPAIAIKDE